MDRAAVAPVTVMKAEYLRDSAPKPTESGEMCPGGKVLCASSHPLTTTPEFARAEQEVGEAMGPPYNQDSLYVNRNWVKT